MTDRTQTFDLKLLTSSKEVGLRRLRTYAAALGGGAQIFHTYEDLRRNLESTFTGRRKNIVLHDGTVPLTSPQMLELQHFGRVFVLQPQGQVAKPGVPAPTAPC